MHVRSALPRAFLTLGLLCAGLGAGWAAITAGEASAAGDADSPAQKTESVILAGGCFWCVESDFDKVPGVVATISGYAGGQLPNPTYEHHTGHREVVRVTYDPGKVSFPQLVSYFWRTIDPLDAGGQFCDRGDSYTTAIYPLSPEQTEQANRSKAQIEGMLGKKVATPVIQLDPSAFTEAEGYHQNYHTINSLKYTFYRYRCGRDERLKQLWGDDAGKWPPRDGVS
jgi:peptide-methionine (S)-S-oxide reductase